ncbi:MAG: M20/M25/M40 family metallo-hydrolase [Gemmatimonadetes bacterium]|nr:M20/M25/M40 family metallo-hydrolase [Gemmatimonadota bacterium]
MFSGALTAVLLVRTAALRAVPPLELLPVSIGINEDRAVARLAGAIQVGISDTNESPSALAMRPGSEGAGALRDYLEGAFPAIASALSWDEVGGGSLLLSWQGKEPGLPPILLASPADGSSGIYVTVGATVGPLVAILEAVDGLLSEGFQPKRTILLAFVGGGSHSGDAGAAELADYLAKEGIRPVWALVEGSDVKVGTMPGLSDPFALIGTAERGSATLRVSASREGGGAAGAPSSNAIARVARAIAHLDEDPFPARVRGPTRELFLTLGPYLDPGTRMLVSNLWLLEGPVARALAQRPGLEPAVRTTLVPVRFSTEGGDAELGAASTELSVGIAPWDTPDTVLARAWGVVSDLGVEVVFPSNRPAPIPPSRVSSSQSEGFELIQRAVFRTFPDVIAAPPGVVEAPTPGRYYDDVAEDVFRFVPLRAEAGTGVGTRGTTERVRVPAFLDMIRFYAGLIREAAG